MAVKRNNDRRNQEPVIYDNKLIAEIESLQIAFAKTTEKLIKDVKRQDKIMARSDKRQQKEYDELQKKLKCQREKYVKKHNYFHKSFYLVFRNRFLFVKCKNINVEVF